MPSPNYTTVASYSPDHAPLSIPWSELHPAFGRMLRKSEKSGLPERFGADLTYYDATFLQGYFGAFVWYLYPSGTHLVKVGENPTAKDVRQTLETCEMIEGTFTDLQCYFVGENSTHLTRVRDHTSLARILWCATSEEFIDDDIAF